MICGSALLDSVKYLGLMSAVVPVLNALVDRSSILSLTAPQVPYGILHECDSIPRVVCRCQRKPDRGDIRLSTPNRPDPWRRSGEGAIGSQVKCRADKRGQSLQFFPVIGANQRSPQRAGNQRLNGT